MKPIFEDVDGVTTCTGCGLAVRNKVWITVRDFPEFGIRVVAFPCQPCECTHVEARPLPCEKAGPS